MTLEKQKFIKENRLKLSMIDISKAIHISYNKVRNYMVENNLMLSKTEINNVKIIKRSNKNKSWNWDAMP